MTGSVKGEKLALGNKTGKMQKETRGCLVVVAVDEGYPFAHTLRHTLSDVVFPSRVKSVATMSRRYLD